jgi:Putative restriction endonuclease
MNLEEDPLTATAESEVLNSPPVEPQPVMIPFPPEDYPSVEHLILDDGKPVDNVFIEKLMRLMTESLYSSWTGPGGGRPFLVFSDVGLFYEPKQTPLSPDVMLSLDVGYGDPTQKESRSYYLWVMGKPPDAIVEVVSDRTGGELNCKMHRYAQIGVAYYVVFDPRNILKQGPLQAFARVGTEYQPIDPTWMPGIHLGLKLWEGEFEGWGDTWLRWCDRDGNVIPTGAERGEQEKQRASEADQRADAEKQRADKEKQRANKAEHRADEEKQRADRLAEQLRALGVDPDKL